MGADRSIGFVIYVDADGQPEDNSFYTGMIQGFQVFAFNDAFGDGGCLDVIGHEYTHCFTEAAMSFNLYENDYGAINEGFSDIMGNLMEIILNDSEEGAWKMGENQLNGVFRVMDDPHKYEQPAFVWDRYYKPNAPVPLEELDWGGFRFQS